MGSRGREEEMGSRGRGKKWVTGGGRKKWVAGGGRMRVGGKGSEAGKGDGRDREGSSMRAGSLEKKETFEVCSTDSFRGYHIHTIKTPSC